MRIFESVQARITQENTVQKAVILTPDDKCSNMTSSIIRIPPLHNFPTHIHPDSEDCFFILSGGGEVFNSKQRILVSKISVVWVPPGVPHGLSTNELGAVEVGFQPSLTSTIEVAENHPTTDHMPEIRVASIPLEIAIGSEVATWLPVFTKPVHWQYFEAYYCHLPTSKNLPTVAKDVEMIIVVARGKVRVDEQLEGFAAITVIHIEANESKVLHAVEAETLLICIVAQRT